MKLIFVYGTMKAGQSQQLYNNARYLGHAKTKPQYVIYQYGGLPALAAAESGDSVVGELYEVTDPFLAGLDKSEPNFNRKPIDLEEITLVKLPLHLQVWNDIESKTASAYFFKAPDKLSGAKACGPFWSAST